MLAVAPPAAAGRKGPQAERRGCTACDHKEHRAGGRIVAWLPAWLCGSCAGHCSGESFYCNFAACSLFASVVSHIPMFVWDIVAFKVTSLKVSVQSVAQLCQPSTFSRQAFCVNLNQPAVTKWNVSCVCCRQPRRGACCVIRMHAWAASCCPLPASWGTQCQTSTSRCPASPACLSTPTSSVGATAALFLLVQVTACKPVQVLADLP